MNKNLIQLADEYRRLDRKRKIRGGKLSPQEEKRLAQLKDYLSQSLHESSPGTDRRGDLRVPVSMRVRYHTGNVFTNNYISNLSSGGVFISTPKPLPLDTKVKLQLIFEDRNIEIDIEGKVVWENTQGRTFGDITKPGMGIKFTKVGKEAQEVIDDLVHDLLDEQARIKQERQERKK